MNAPDRAAFLAARKSGIGGSDVGAILCLSPFRTPLDVYLDKTGQSPDIEENEAMYWGIQLEGMVASEYATRTGQRVQRVNTILRRSDWMVANIDRAVVVPGSRARVDANGQLVGAAGILECKTASAYKAGEWGRDGDDDAVPAAYAAQAMWYMAVTGHDWCDVAALIGGNRFLIKRVERDDETIRAMIERAEEFWRGNVLAGKAPDPINDDDLRKLYPESVAGKTVDAEESIVATIGRLRDLRDDIDALSAQEAELLQKIKARMCDAEAIAFGGITLATWKSAAPARKTDWKAVAADLEIAVQREQFAAAVANHTITAPPVRRFLLKGK